MSTIKVQGIQTLSGNAAISFSEEGIPTFSSHVIESIPIVEMYKYTGATGAQSITAGTWAVYNQFDADSVVIDTHGFADHANNRILPTIPGYYFINAWASPRGTSATTQGCGIYIDETLVTVEYFRMGSTTTDTQLSTAGLFYFNGSNTYAQVSTYSNGSSTLSYGARISAYLVRAD